MLLFYIINAFDKTKEFRMCLLLDQKKKKIINYFPRMILIFFYMNVMYIITILLVGILLKLY